MARRGRTSSIRKQRHSGGLAAGAGLGPGMADLAASLNEAAAAAIAELPRTDGTSEAEADAGKSTRATRTEKHDTPAASRSSIRRTRSSATCSTGLLPRRATPDPTSSGSSASSFPPADCRSGHGRARYPAQVGGPDRVGGCRDGWHRSDRPGQHRHPAHRANSPSAVNAIRRHGGQDTARADPRWCPGRDRNASETVNEMTAGLVWRGRQRRRCSSAGRSRNSSCRWNRQPTGRRAARVASRTADDRPVRVLRGGHESLGRLLRLAEARRSVLRDHEVRRVGSWCRGRVHHGRSRHLFLRWCREWKGEADKPRRGADGAAERARGPARAASTRQARVHDQRHDRGARVHGQVRRVHDVPVRRANGTGDRLQRWR